jgi:Zn-dependent protease with chaperone function
VGGVTSRFRTWLFVAGLTALLIGAGALAGGAFLYAFVALAVLMNLAGYWFSDRILAPIAAMLLQLAVSRQREYLADATAARLLGGGRPLAEALESLERRTQAAPVAVSPAFASLYIANPLPRAGLATLFSTHPPIPERVRRLRGYEA